MGYTVIIMWQELAELIGGDGSSQALLAECLLHLVLTTAWAPLNALLALFITRRGLVVTALAEWLMVLLQRPPLGFFLWETGAIAVSMALAQAWVYHERPQGWWDRLGLVVGAVLVALGINGTIALAVVF